MTSSFTVIGGGAWGTALAVHLTRITPEVKLWMRNASLADTLNQSHSHPSLPGVTLPKSLQAITDIHLIHEHDTLIMALPSQAYPDFITEHRSLFQAGQQVIIASKGLVMHQGEPAFITDLFQDLPVKPMVLSGPSFALEVAQGLPTAMILAIEEDTPLTALQHQAFRVYQSDDIPGVQMAGVVKNVLAVAIGLSDGMGYGYNARAALICRGLAEIKRLYQALGYQENTLYGLAGLGDLVLTATSDLSRNRTFGWHLGQGLTVEQAVVKVGHVVESVHSVDNLLTLAQRHAVILPIATSVQQVLSGQQISDVMTALLSRNTSYE